MSLDVMPYKALQDKEIDQQNDIGDTDPADIFGAVFSVRLREGEYRGPDHCHQCHFN